MSQHVVKDENLAEKRLDFTNIVNFEGINIVFGSFVHNMPESKNEMYFKMLQPEVTAGCQRW